MKIYTKRGDQGMTDLFGGERVKKTCPRVIAYGDIDCANSSIGLAYSTDGIRPQQKERLLRVMKLLFCLGAEIATAEKQKAEELLEKHLKNRVENEHILFLEQDIDEMEESLMPLKSFVLPCGTDAAARLHCARVLVRKAEISLLELAENGEHVRPTIIQFINRLSDYLFVMARVANAEALCQEITWNGQLSL